VRRLSTSHDPPPSTTGTTWSTFQNYHTHTRTRTRTRTHTHTHTQLSLHQRYVVASLRGGLGWTCPSHFCQRSLLKLIQVRRVFTGERLVRLRFGFELKVGASVAHLKAKRFSASGGLGPPDQGSAPGPRWGLRLQTPVIGWRPALAKSVHPTYCDLAMSVALRQVSSGSSSKCSWVQLPANPLSRNNLGQVVHTRKCLRHQAV